VSTGPDSEEPFITLILRSLDGGGWFLVFVPAAVLGGALGVLLASLYQGWGLAGLSLAGFLLLASLFLLFAAIVRLRADIHMEKRCAQAALDEWKREEHKRRRLLMSLARATRRKTTRQSAGRDSYSIAP
jgi:apolipoprotein N-acyltransferase